MADDSFNIEWTGLTQLAAEIDEMDFLLLSAIEDEMRNYLNLVEEGAKALAFRFGGDLEQSIVAMPVRTVGGSVTGHVGTNLIYAWRLHESPYSRGGSRDLYHNGIRLRGYYIGGRGRRTRDKATWRGQLPGRKFLERAITATENDFGQLMFRALARTVGG